MITEHPSFCAGDLLVPAVGKLHSQLTAASKNGEPLRRDLAHELELLPYALGAAYLAVSEVLCAVEQVAHAHEPKGGEFVVVPPESRYLVGYKIDAFLDAARRAQNAITFYWSRALRKSIGKSLSQVAEGAKAGRSRLPDWAQTCLVSYWSRYGRRVKEYRDLSQHFAVVVSDVRVFRSQRGAGELKVFAALPNDPGITAADKLEYRAPVVMAIDFLEEQLLALLSFTNQALRPLIEPSEAYQMVDRIIFRSAVRNEPGGEPLGTPIRAQAYLRARVESLGSGMWSP
jgi:hypothetical protein